MRKRWAFLVGMGAAVAGLLSVWPSVPAQRRPRLALAQWIATEDPCAALLAGCLAAWQGRHARDRRAIALGLVGVVLRIRPWLKRNALNRQMAEAMRDGLGIGWQRRIPPERHRAFFQRHRTDWIGPLQWLPRLRVRETQDVLFAVPDGHPLRVDVYEPAAQDGPYPAILVLHGGTWFTGDKGRPASVLRHRWLAAQGYVVFDAQYRLMGHWPAPLADVRSAIRWIKAHAGRYYVNPDRVALMGQAAGAHLALLAAYTAGGEDAAATERVSAVVVSAPPADLRLWPATQDGAMAQLLGGSPDEIPEVYEQAAPVTHIHADAPPTLIVQGQRDRTVPPIHADLLANLLRAVGATVVLLRMPWGRHGVDGFPLGLSGPMIQYDIDRFLAWAFAQGEGTR